MAPADDPVLRLGQNAQVGRDLAQLLEMARAGFARRDIRATADALSAAVLMAQQNGLHRAAARFRKARVILSNGGRPKLLTRAAASEDDGPCEHTEV